MFWSVQQKLRKVQMYRLVIIAMTVLALTGQALSASPKDDATYLAQQMLSNEALETTRELLRRRLVVAYEDPLAEVGVGIADHDRFAAMLPNSATDGPINNILQRIENKYLELFTPQQLVEIAAFHRSDLGQKLLNALEEQALQDSYDNNLGVRFTDIYAHEQSYLAQLLTPEELLEFYTFSESDSGKALQENANSLGTTAGFSVIGRIMEVSMSEPQIDLDTPYMIDILETDGIIAFPNRIWRNDLIKQLRNDLQ
jgi:hypothetical protein